jgi:translation elongation factor EF-Tu-like GTPase
LSRSGNVQKSSDYGEVGDNIGIPTRGTKKDEFDVVMYWPNPEHPTLQTFRSEAYILTKKEVGDTRVPCRITDHNSSSEQQCYWNYKLPVDIELATPGDE